jgi:hypothetical protein
VINDTYLKTIIDKATVARLATVDSECKPHLIPVVFVFDNDCYFIPIDEKTKRSKPENLKRVKNIQQNPNVALLIDEYDEDWRICYNDSSTKSNNLEKCMMTIILLSQSSDHIAIHFYYLANLESCFVMFITLSRSLPIDPNIM